MCINVLFFNVIDHIMDYFKKEKSTKTEFDTKHLCAYFAIYCACTNIYKKVSKAL